MNYKRKGIVLVLLMVMLINVFSVDVSAVSKKAPGKVKSSSILQGKVSKDYKYVTFKWKKVKGASGYQVVLIDADTYDFDDVSLSISRDWTTKNQIKIVGPNADDYDWYRVKVRAYKYVKGKEVYGQWSVSDFRFAPYYY